MLSCSRHLMAAAAAGASVPPPPPQMQFAISPSAEPIPHLKPSSSSRRKPSFYFPRMRDEAYDKSAFRPGTLGSAAPLFAITSTSCDYYALRLPLLKAGFRRVDAPYLNLPSNLLWGRSMLTLDDVEPPFFMQLTNRFQRFNHFPSSHKNLGCKRGMGMNVYAFLSTVAQRERWGELMPKTWFYPEDRAELERVFAAAPNDSQFIWKPARGSCGRGICITQGGPSHAADWKTVMNEIDEKICSEITGKLFRQYVVQSYLQDPLLLEEHKMDLRLYVLVTSYDPLVVYWFDEGLVRLAAEEYTEHDETTGDAALTHANLNRFRHLTNFSVGRKFHADDDDADANANANASDAAAEKAPLELDSPTEGTPLKWSLAKLWRHIDTTIAPRDPTQRPASAEIKEQIALLITRTLMAVKPILTGTSHKKEMSQDGSFFEIYGFDVILDKSLHPLLLEVNTMPSLESSSCFDYAVKTSVVADVLNMAMLQPFDRSAAAFHPAGGVVSEDFRGLEPPSAEARHYIHTAAEVQATSSMSMKEHMEELRHRLKDEDLYSRGFKRIFPPLPTSRRDAPLTAASEDIRRDIDMYREMKLLSQRDEAVLADV